MKIGMKIGIGLFLIIGLGSLVQALVRIVVEGEQEQQTLKNLVTYSVNRLANSLIAPIWSLDNAQLETVIRLELADANILAVELEDQLEKLSGFFLRGEEDIVKYSLAEARQNDLASKALFSLTKSIVYEGNEIGRVTVYATDRVLVEKMNQRLWYNTFFVLIFAAALLGGIAVMLRRLVVHPLSELTRVVTHFSKKDLGVRSSYVSSDEIGTLAQEYNRMLDTIQEYTESLEQKVQERTRELAEANEVLRRQKDEMERNLRIAQKIQLKLIPNENTYPRREELTFSSFYTAMETVGGDIFDIIRSGRNSFGLLMADVSGHGVPAALVTAMAKVSFNTHAQAYGVSPAEVCARVNKDIASLLGNDYSHYLTAFFGIIDLERQKFTWSNCGHHPAILLRGETVIRLGSPGPFIGFVENADFYEETIDLEKGDRIVLFTDGIVEARNAHDEMFDIHRLIRLCLEYRRASASEFIKNLLAKLQDFCEGQRQDDDRAVLVVDYYQRYDTEGHLVGDVDIQTGGLPMDKGQLGEALKSVHALIKAERYQEAKQLAQEIHQRHPEEVATVTFLAFILYKLADYSQALEVLDRVPHLVSLDERLKRLRVRIQERLSQRQVP